MNETLKVGDTGWAPSSFGKRHHVKILAVSDCGNFVKVIREPVHYARTAKSRWIQIKQFTR